MCFIIHPDYPNPLIAEQDIVCFKVVLRIENLPSRVISQFRSYTYKLGELQPKVELTPERGSFPVPSYLKIWGGHYVWSINKGYHSYHPLNYRVQDGYDVISKFCLVRCTIPKGSQYYYNPEHQEYISDQIIAQEIL